MNVNEDVFADERPGGSNPSDNPTLDSLIADRAGASGLSRRGVLAGLASAGSLAFLGGLAGPAAAAPTPSRPDGPGGRRRPPRRRPAAARLHRHRLPAPTTRPSCPTATRGEVLIPWGTPIRSRRPGLAQDGSNTAAEQAEQVGFNHDGMHYFPLAAGSAGQPQRGLLVLNHEYTDAHQIYSTARAAIAVMTGRRRSPRRWPATASPWSRSPSAPTARGPTSSARVQPPHHRHHARRFAGPVSADHPLAAVGAHACRRGAPSTTAPTASPRGAPTSPARRTGTATSAPTTRPWAATPSRPATA